MKSRFNEILIARILKELDSGRSVKEVCRENNISDTTYYTWKSKYAEMKSSNKTTSNNQEKMNTVG